MGQVPRGFLGGTGPVEDVVVVMVFAEPGHPHPHEGEVYPESGGEATMLAALEHADRCHRETSTQFHKNVRAFLDMALPDMTFDEQLKRAWLTEGRLCSIEDEIGDARDGTCAEVHLARQLDLLPNAVVLGFGGKAKRYLKRLGVDHLECWALAPPGCNRKEARKSWEVAAAEIRRQLDH